MMFGRSGNYPALSSLLLLEFPSKNPLHVPPGNPRACSIYSSWRQGKVLQRFALAKESPELAELPLCDLRRDLI